MHNYLLHLIPILQHVLDQLNSNAGIMWLGTKSVFS
jgi:hypothetical protein